MEHFRESWGKK